MLDLRYKSLKIIMFYTSLPKKKKKKKVLKRFIIDRDVREGGPVLDFSVCMLMETDCYTI